MKRIALALVLLVLGTSSAQAEEDDRDEYFGSMAIADLALMISAAPVISAAEGHEGGMALVYGLAYLTAGPFIHAVHGNAEKIGGSLAKRALLPVGVGLVGGLVGLAGSTACDGELCFLGTIVGGVAGAGLGAIIAVVWDWSTAHLDRTPARVTPTLTADGDRVSLGLAGAY